MKIVLASSNAHKVKEINAIVQNPKILGNKFQTPIDIEFILPPDGFDPIENGTTFEENSYIKAYAAWEISKNWTLADDSGLCIDALNGNPGIYSARYADTPQTRIDRVLKELDGVQNRTAHFECAMTLINPKGEVAFACKGICEGSIVDKQRGNHGFGYDPIFLLKNSDKTIAELDDDEKNRISHRSKALVQVLEYLTQIQ